MNQMFRTSDGKLLDGNDKDLLIALNVVADEMAATAHAIREQDDYASHVTEAKKDCLLRDAIRRSDEVRQGSNMTFTTWQRVNEKLTGECVSFLPPTESRQ